MSEQEAKLTEVVASSESSINVSNEQNQLSETSEKVTPSPTTLPKSTPTRQATMPQDVRYATEPNDREKLIVKYDNYQISDINSCNVRFLVDNRQKKNLLGRYEEENSSLGSLSKTFNVNIFAAYQQQIKHSYKIFGAENSVRQCLIEIMNRMFKRIQRSTLHDPKEIDNQLTVTTVEKAQDTGNSSGKDDDSKSSSVLPAASNEPEASTVEQEKSVATEQTQQTNESAESVINNPDSLASEDKTEQVKYIPLERKAQYTFIMLISSQGQEVLKKNWNFFAGSLQQRLNVIVMNPVKLLKFGDKQVYNELPITGESFENLSDACLQIGAFINDVLGIPIQVYKPDVEPIAHEHNRHQRQKDDNHSHRPAHFQHQGQASVNNYQGRTFFNRNRNEPYEQIVFIRSDCVPRIVGTRASNLKRIQTKCHLREMIVGRQPNENGYTECFLSAFQLRNIHFAIDTIRSFLKNENESAVLVVGAKYSDVSTESSGYLQQSVPSNVEQSSTSTLSETHQTSKETGFLTQPLNIAHTRSYPQPSYNFQNTPSFDFTHQATSAARKTDKRPGEIHEHNRTLNDSQNEPNENLSSTIYSSNSPRHKSKRTCPETKEIDCTTDDGFWIQKQYYHALDDASKQLFDSLLEKLEKIRIVSEDNAARKQQRLVGRNRSNKTRSHTSSVSYLNEDNNQNEKDLMVKPILAENNTKNDQSVDTIEEKENNHEPPTVIVTQD